MFPIVALPFYIPINSALKGLRLLHIFVSTCYFLFLFPFFKFFKVYLIDYAVTIVPFFPSHLFPSAQHPLSLQHSPTLVHSTTLVHSMGLTYKFFGFYISYIILNLPLSILYLPFMLLIPGIFSPILLPPSPHC